MITPEQLAAPGTEHALQVALFCWSARQIDRFPDIGLMFAIPNGGERNIIVASRMRAEGVKSGVSDICLPVPRHAYHGFFIEMKKPGGKESETQKAFGKGVMANGYLYSMFDCWEKAANALTWYLSNGAEHEHK